jgi:hypothetical protein
MTITTGSSRTGRPADRGRTMHALLDDDRGRLKLRRLRLAGGVSRARGRGAFRPLAGNKALVRVVGGYVLFTLTQYSVWVAMLVYAYRQGGAAVAGRVAEGRDASPSACPRRPHRRGHALPEAGVTACPAKGKEN